MLLYQFHKYNEKKYFANINRYIAYKKLKHLNTKIRKISDKLKETCGITFGTTHMKCAKPPDTNVKCANSNRIPIQNFAPVYQMQLRTVSIDLIIGGRTFAFVRGTRSSDPIEYLLCNHCELNLSEEDTYKVNGPQFI